MPTCQMSDDRQIAAHVWQKFYKLHLKLRSDWIDVRQIFTRYRGINVASNACIYKTILHFVLECHSEGSQCQSLQRSHPVRAPGPNAP